MARVGSGTTRGTVTPMSDDPAGSYAGSWARRREMVEALRAGGVDDARVLAAMGAVPRERFVAGRYAAVAYEPRPLPIAAGQRISAPSIVATMTAALELRGGERVLEIGAGSGYGAAVLSRLAAEVLTIEHHPELVEDSRQVLGALGYDNVEVRHGDGVLGAPDRAPFDAVSVTAMAPHEVPTALVEQLSVEGVLVCPVGGEQRGELIRLQHGRTRSLGPVAFVPLTSDHQP